MFRSLLSVLAATFLGVSAQAATFNISFMTVDGGSAGTGSFEADDVSFGVITAFSAVVNGLDFTNVISTFSPALLKDFPNLGDLAVSAFILKSGETVENNTDVLQLFGIGRYNDDGTVVLETQWGFSRCRTEICGGGGVLGSYVVTRDRDPMPPVPLPASALLLPLGLGALVLTARRRRVAQA